MSSQIKLPSKIEQQEYKKRVSKVQEILKDQKIDVLFCTLGINSHYLFGLRAHLSERLTLGIVSRNSPAHLVCPAFEQENYSSSSSFTKEYIHIWEETENPFEKVATICRSLDISDSSIAITPDTPFTFYSRIAKSLPQANFVDGLDALKKARITKTDKEIECLKAASQASCLGIEKTFEELQEGMTEIEISQLVSKNMSDLSGEPAQFAAVQINENSALPHGLPTSKKLTKNSVVLIDAGTTVQGYHGDITNTTFYGKPSREFLEIYNIVEEANQHAVEKSVIGTIPAQVDQTAREIITKKGYGNKFTHRTGHGIGLEVHEDPYIVGDNKVPLEENQVHSIEPGIYLVGKFGVRIEDDVIVGKKSGIRASSPHRRFWE
ncbi:MAG: M24 family metallopeptidase [Candidatus Thorarchaeota archaeon]